MKSPSTSLPRAASASIPILLRSTWRKRRSPCCVTRQQTARASSSSAAAATRCSRATPGRDRGDQRGRPLQKVLPQLLLRDEVGRRPRLRHDRQERCARLRGHGENADRLYPQLHGAGLNKICGPCRKKHLKCSKQFDKINSQRVAFLRKSGCRNAARFFTAKGGRGQLHSQIVQQRCVSPD